MTTKYATNAERASTWPTLYPELTYQLPHIPLERNLCILTSPLSSLFSAREIQQATESDDTLRALKDIILHGWPEECSQTPAQVTPYFSIRDELSLQDGVIFRGQRMVIPSSLRRDMKQEPHASHLGVGSCLRRARETIFWLGMSTEIKEMVATCETCRKYETSNQK